MVKIISWNNCGIANDSFKRKIREVIRKHRPDVLFILETRTSGEKAKRIYEALGFSNKVKVRPRN